MSETEDYTPKNIFLTGGAGTIHSWLPVVVVEIEIEIEIDIDIDIDRRLQSSLYFANSLLLFLASATFILYLLYYTAFKSLLLFHNY